jgi:hypothetical protein
MGLLGGSASVPTVAEDAIAKISVEYSGSDRIGNLLVYELRNEIDRSPALVVGDDGDDGWKIVVLTMEGPDSSTIYSTTLVRKNFDRAFDYFLITDIGVCQAETLPRCARDIVAGIEGPVIDYDTNWQESEATAAAQGGRNR